MLFKLAAEEGTARVGEGSLTGAANPLHWQILRALRDKGVFLREGIRFGPGKSNLIFPVNDLWMNGIDW